MIFLYYQLVLFIYIFFDQINKKIETESMGKIFVQIKCKIELNTWHLLSKIAMDFRLMYAVPLQSFSFPLTTAYMILTTLA